MTGLGSRVRRLRLARVLVVALLVSPMAACSLFAPSRDVVPPPPPPPPPPVVGPPDNGGDLPTCPGDPRCDRA